MKTKACLFLLIVAAASLLVVGLIISQKKESPSQVPAEQTIPSESTEKEIPLLTEEDIIRLFFQLIDEKRIDEALSMMSPKAGQSWRPYLESFQKIKLLEVEKTELGSFRVLLDVEMTSDSARGSIPFFGYSNGQNIKFVNLVKENDTWKIEGIATGP